jgi:hypothetical protein
MQFRWSVLTFALATIAAAGPASACFVPAELALEDVRFADTVVVGRIANYHLALDAKIRRELKPMFGHRPGWEKGPFMPDYARFDILVDEVLAGEAGPSIAATWDNSTFPEPETMAPGPYVIALRRSGSALPPLRGPSATILPSPERRTLAVLQAPCAGPFLFEAGSEQAAAVRRILAERPGAG